MDCGDSFGRLYGKMGIRVKTGRVTRCRELIGIGIMAGRMVRSGLRGHKSH